jgi:hypothetical protein
MYSPDTDKVNINVVAERCLKPLSQIVIAMFLIEFVRKGDLRVVIY